MPTPPSTKSPTEELPAIQRKVDFFVSKKARTGVLDRFEEKYGEKLEAPAPAQGIFYDDLIAAEQAAEGGDTTVAELGDVQVADAASIAASDLEPQAAPAGGESASGDETGTEDSSVPAGRPKKEQGPKTSMFVRELPLMTTGQLFVRFLKCEFTELTCLPFYKYGKYRSDDKPIKWAFLVLDILILLTIFPLLVKILLGIVFGILRAVKKSSARSREIKAKQAAMAVEQAEAARAAAGDAQ